MTIPPAIRGIFYAIILITLFYLIFSGLVSMDKSLGMELPGVLKIVGIPLVIGGLFLALWCAILLVLRGHGTPAPFDPPKKFVVLGPYRYVRNPMMLGGFSALLGVSFILASLSGILFILLLSLLFQLFILYIEEPGLLERFGKNYEDYKKNNPRWIPFFKKENTNIQAPDPK